MNKPKHSRQSHRQSADQTASGAKLLFKKPPDQTGRGNPKSAPCMIGVMNTAWSNVMYKPRTSPTLLRCSLACSSDQKKTDLLQNASMMLGSVSLHTSTSGTKTRGSAPSSTTRYVSSSSTSMCSDRAQCAHSVSMMTDSGPSRNCPCTKGVAIASIAQAAYTCSPVSKAT